MADNQPGSPRELAGSCLCGTTGFVVADEFEYALYCHCSLCRRTSGSAFKAIAGIKRNRLKPVGRQDVLTYGNEAGPRDVHCARCGSMLYSVVRDGVYAHVAMGTLVDDPSIRPSMHICVGSKAGWYEIADDLPRHDGLPQRS